MLSQLIDEFNQTPQYLPLAYPAGASASPLSDHGLETLAIRDVSSVEEVLRLLTPTGRLDAPLFVRVLTATAKECSFDNAAITGFLASLRGSDIAQIDELAKEWAFEGMKSDLDEDRRGVWWVIANLVSVGFLAIEDVVAQVVSLILSPSKVLPSPI